LEADLKVRLYEMQGKWVKSPRGPATVSEAAVYRNAERRSLVASRVRKPAPRLLSLSSLDKLGMS
jgi:hypothetical protein